MDKEKQLRDIGSDLDTLQAHIKRLKKKEKEIHRLDIDLLLENTRKLYDKILKLESDDSDQKTIVLPESMPEAEIPEVAFSTQGISPGPLVVEEKVEEKAEVEAEAKAEVKEKEEKEEEEAKVEAEKEEKAKAEAEKEKVKTNEEKTKQTESKPIGKRRTESFGDPIGIVPEPPAPDVTVTEEPSVTNEDEKKTAFDLFSSNAEETVGDKLGKTDDASVADKMQKSQIADLRQAIGINEKFLFINELFNGDLGRYNKAIDEFNALSNQQGVDTYLLEMKIHNQWPDDSEAFIKLKALLDRKFG